MPQYFFHVMDGRAFIDREGTELAGITQVREEAIRTAGTILAKETTGLSSGKPWQMTVADADGKVVFSLRFVATEYGG